MLYFRSLFAAVIALLIIGCEPQTSRVTAPSHNISNFSAAKNELREVYREHPQSFYCGCDFYYQGKKLVPDLNGCAYQIRKETQRVRAERIEWEHVVPASRLGGDLSCWKEGGRKNCRSDSTFKVLESDLHNLTPAIGEINGDRSDFDFTYWHDDQGAFYGQCEMKIDFKAQQAHPPERSRGAIARTYLYMAERYNVQLTSREQELFDAWNESFEPTTWECTRNEALTRLQGNDNRFVTEACQTR